VDPISGIYPEDVYVIGPVVAPAERMTIGYLGLASLITIGQNVSGVLVGPVLGGANMTPDLDIFRLPNQGSCSSSLESSTLASADLQNPKDLNPGYQLAPFHRESRQA
jgi:hypothetical protein